MKVRTYSGHAGVFAATPNPRQVAPRPFRVPDMNIEQRVW